MLYGLLFVSSIYMFIYYLITHTALIDIIISITTIFDKITGMKC